MVYYFQSAPRGRPLPPQKLGLQEGGLITASAGHLVAGIWAINDARTKLTLRWFKPGAPGGVWIDTYTSTDGVDFEGTNNNNPVDHFIGKLSTPRAAD